MNAIRSLTALALLALALTSTGTANTFSVTMTCTVTQSNDAQLLVGTIFQNIVSYTSDGANGMFFATLDPTNSANSDLYGSILTPLPIAVPGQPIGNGSIYDWIDIAGAVTGVGNNTTSMSVTDDQVSAFLWNFQRGWSNAYYDATSFFFSTSNHAQTTSPSDPIPENWIVRGSVNFGAIETSGSQSERVPDDGTTMLLLLVSIAGLAGIARIHPM